MGEVAKYRAQTIVLKRALLDQRNVIKDLELSARPVERFTSHLSIAFRLSKRPTADALDFVGSFINALEGHNNISTSLLLPRTENNLVKSAEQNRMKLLKLMGKFNEDYDIKVLQLLRNLIIQVNALISYLKNGLEVPPVVKSQIVILALDSERFLLQAADFYKAVKADTERHGKLKTAASNQSSIAINLMNLLYSQSRDRGISLPESSTLPEKDRVESDRTDRYIQTEEVTAEESKAIEITQKNEHALLQQYAITIQALIAKSKAV